MNVILSYEEKTSDHDLPCIDIVAGNPDSAFELGRLFEALINGGMCGWIIDGHGIRIPLSKRNRLGLVSNESPAENSESAVTSNNTQSTPCSCIGKQYGFLKVCEKCGGVVGGSNY